MFVPLVFPLHHSLSSFHRAASRLSETAHTLLQESQEVQQEVSDVLVNMQFQDRVNQILAQTRTDMERFQALLDGRRAELANGQLPERVRADQWLAEMERSYTTIEQQLNHSGGRQVGAPQNSEITFF